MVCTYLTKLILFNQLLRLSIYRKNGLRQYIFLSFLIAISILKLGVPICPYLTDKLTLLQ